MEPWIFSSSLAFQVLDTPDLWERFTVTRIVTVVLLIFFTWALIRLLATFFAIFSLKFPRSRFLIRLLEPALRIGLWFFAIISSFSLLAPSSQTFWAALASAGLALGLGAQDLIKNVVGGLVILTDRPYQIGDRVKIGDAYGEVDNIGLRSTKLTTPDDTRVTIPNLDVLNLKVFNANSGVPDCQVVTDIFLPPETDPRMALRIGREAALCSPYLHEKKPIVALASHGFDRRPYFRLRIKAYVYDHRHEPAMQSDVTARALSELGRLGALRWPDSAEPRS